MKRITVILAAALLLSGGAAHAASQRAVPRGKIDSVVVVIDGRVSDGDRVNELPAEEIKSFSVLKLGRQSLMIVHTENEAEDGGKPLVTVNGLEVDDLLRVDRRYIERIDPLGEEEARRLYGDRGERGVLAVTLHGVYDGRPVRLEEVMVAKLPQKTSADGAKTAADAATTDNGGADGIVVKGSAGDLAGVVSNIRIDGRSGDGRGASQPLMIVEIDGGGEKRVYTSLDNINSYDIASVTVLKNRSADLFGAYGDTSNGVILVTLKKGTAFPPVGKGK